MNMVIDPIVKNFLRRWSTLDITPENAVLFDMELSGVRAIVHEDYIAVLTDITRNTPRAEFANMLVRLQIMERR